MHLIAEISHSHDSLGICDGRYGRPWSSLASPAVKNIREVLGYGVGAMVVNSNPIAPTSDTNLPKVPSERIRSRVWSGCLGLAAGFLILILRRAGLCSGFSAIAIGAIAFLFVPGPRRVADRIFLIAGVGLGWIPLVAWIPNIGLKVDVPGIFLAVAVAAAVSYQILPRESGSRTVSWPTGAESLALAVCFLTTLYWLHPFSHLAASGILGVLLLGWDNTSHFEMFKVNLQEGSYIQTLPPIHGGTQEFNTYPQGLHQVWAIFERLLSPHPPTSSSWLLHAYSNLQVLTTGGIVLLGCMAVARVCGRNFLVAVPAMAVIVALFTTGSFGPFIGFTNWTVSVVAVAIAVTMIMTPSLSPLPNFIVVSGFCIVIAYNWLPLMFLAGAALLLAMVRAWIATRGVTRVAFIICVIVWGLAVLSPARTILQLGIGTLNQNGGAPIPPWGPLFFSIAALIAVGIIRQRLRPNLPTNLVIISPAVLGILMFVAAAWYERSTVGAVVYYGQKFGSALFAICCIVLVTVVSNDLATMKVRQRLGLPAALVASVFVTLAVLQIDGYVGPYVPGMVDTYANGLAIHRYLYQLPPTDDDASRLLTAVRETPNQDQHWNYIDPAPVSGRNPVLLGFWLLALRDHPSTLDWSGQGGEIPAPPGLSMLAYAKQMAIQHPDPIADAVHFIVPAALKDALISLNPSWGKPGVLLIASVK